MSVNVLGGSLEFDAILTTDGLGAAMASIEADLLKIIERFEKVGNVGTASLDDLKKRFAELVAQEKALTEASANATDPAKVKEYNDKIGETIAKMKDLSSELNKVQQSSSSVVIPTQPGAAIPVVPVNAGQRLEELRAKMVELEKEEIRLQTALERTLNPELIRQYNAAIDVTIAKMTALGKEIQAAQAASPSESVASAVSPTTPATPTPTEDPVEPIKKQILAYQQLQNLRNKLASMDKNDPLFKATFDEALRLQGKINEVNRSLQLFSRGTAGLQALTGAVRGVVGGFEVWNGVLGITADQNDEVQKAVTRAVSAMSVLNGIQEVVALFDKQNATNLYLTNLLRKESAVATEQQVVAEEALAVAEGEQAVAAEAATVAQVELNTAMEANPAGILLLALTGIVVALQAFASSQKDVTEQQTKANEAAAEGADILNKLVELQREVYDERARDASNAVNLAQAQGKSDQQVLDLKLKALEAQKQANLFALAGLGYSKEDLGILKASIENVLERQHAINAARDADGELTKEQQKQLDLLNAQLKNYEAQYGPLLRLVDGNKQLTTQIAENRAESDRKINEAGLRSFQAVADTQLQIAKKNTKEELDAKIEAIRRQEAVQLNNANLTAAEQVDIAAKANRQIDDLNKAYQQTLLKDSVDAAQARLAATQKGSEQELDAQIAVIRATAQEQLAEDGLLAGARAKIRAQETADIQEVERKRALLILDNQKESLRAQLDRVEQGSQQELNLKLQLLDNQAKAEIVSAQGNAEKILRINADLEKAQADLRRKYALDASQVEVETIISGINTRLAAVEKGSEEELTLKRKLVDEEARLDILQAEQRITNERQLWAKILEINAEANARKKHLDDSYYDHLLKVQFDEIEKQDRILKAQNDAAINDPLSTPAQIYASQRSNIEIEIAKTKKELAAVQDSITKQQGSAKFLDEQITALAAKLIALKGQERSLDNGEQLRKQQQLQKNFSDFAASLQNLAGAVQAVDQNAAHAIDSVSKFADFASKALSSFAGFSSGNIVGGVTSAIGAISDLFSLISSNNSGLTKDQIAELQNQVIIGEIEVTRQYEQRLLDQAKLNKLRLQGIEEETRLLQQQAKTTQQQFDDLLAKIQQEQGQKLINNPVGGAIAALIPQVLANFSLQGLTYDQLNALFLKGELTDKAKGLFEELQKLKEAGVDIDRQLADAKDQMEQIFTGTTANDIASSIIDGFKAGKRSVADFADDFHDLMLNAMLSALESQTLAPALQEFYDQFAAFSQTDGLLTSDEIEQLQKQYNDILKNAADKFDQLQQIAGVNLSGQASGANSLSGAIKGITADQAELLAGQFGGLRLTAMDQLNMATRQFQVLQDIQRDTSNLPEMKDILRYIKLNGVKITS